MEKDELLLCKCGFSTHQVIIRKDAEDKEVYLEVHLSQKPILKRIWYAIRYVFGYKSIYGAWDAFIFDTDDAQSFKDIHDFLK